MKKIGIIDADLLDNGTRHPNLCCLKLSGWHKAHGDETKLIEKWDEIVYGANNFDHIYVAKVFDYTKVPVDLDKFDNLSYGGTGFKNGFVSYPTNGNNSPPEQAQQKGIILTLPDEIEHHMPDYHLYDQFVAHEIARGIKPIKYKDYTDFSIGYTTRGCFRGCKFCVNESSKGVRFHAHVREFFEPSRKMIYLWDDNILGYSNWREIFEELAETGRRFQYRQGMDIRIMTDEKAEILSNSKYYGDYIFAFDHPEEREYIERGLNCWRKYNNRIPKLYVLCGWDSQDQNDIESTFMRIEVLMKHRALPYIMRHENYQRSKYRGLYINLARWCNQPNFFKKKSFRQYCEANGENSSTFRYMTEFEHDWPDIAGRYYDLRFDQLCGDA